MIQESTGERPLSLCFLSYSVASVESDTDHLQLNVSFLSFSNQNASVLNALSASCFHGRSACCATARTAAPASSARRRNVPLPSTSPVLRLQESPWRRQTGRTWCRLPALNTKTSHQRWVTEHNLSFLGNLYPVKMDSFHVFSVIC